jgi:5'-nucleotidase (lipoprotein e(P4) family)
MALLWMQTSAEYRELCYQAYNVAKIQVNEAIKNTKKGAKPLAIIVDCDETILDNSAYDAGFIGHNDAYASDTWVKWVNAAKASAMPGSTEFLQYAASKGVKVFYVSDRDAKTELDGTMKNLKNLGFPNVDEKHVLLQTDTGNKQPRLDAVSKDYNVAVYMGDDANDLPIGTYGQSLQQRNNTVDKNENELGTKFIALPNPAYGDWESVIASNYWGLTAAQKDKARKALLRTWRADITPASTTTTTTSDTYTINRGDTLFGIAQKFTINWRRIVKLNNIKNSNVICAGKVLKLPSVVTSVVTAYTQKDLNEQDVMALLWMQTSAEYRELCYQAYNVAKIQVDETIKNTKKKAKPLAIIVDCDETILDNSAYDAGFIGYNDAYASDTWAKWVNAAKASAMPGSKEFLQYMARKGVAVFYVSNRDAITGLNGTIKNLKKLGFPNVDKKHVLLQTDTGNKQPRFDAVAKNYNVAVYMGDDANDLPVGTYGQSLQQRNNTVDKNENEFGIKFVALPNPVYGDWEPAIASNYWGLTAAQKDNARKSLLRTWRVD